MQLQNKYTKTFLIKCTFLNKFFNYFLLLRAVCCEILKKAPVRKYEKETGLSPIIGVMAEESSLRKQQYNKSGCNTFGKRNICKPLSIFTEKDIWNLIELDGIDICSVYFDHSNCKSNVKLKTGGLTASL